MKTFFKSCNALIFYSQFQVLFVPFALRKQEDYANKARVPFTQWGFEFDSIHTAEDKVSAVKSAQV